MTSLFIGLIGFSFLYLWYRFPQDETGKLILIGQRKQQLGIGIIFLLLAVLDFLVAPLNEILPLLVRLTSGIFLFVVAGKAPRQVATVLYYVCALLILVRGLLEFIGL